MNADGPAISIRSPGRTLDGRLGTIVHRVPACGFIEMNADGPVVSADFAIVPLFSYQ